MKAPWAKSIKGLINIKVPEERQNTELDEHFKLLKTLQNNRNTIYYTDGAKNNQGTAIGVVQAKDGQTNYKGRKWTSNLTSTEVEILAIREAITWDAEERNP